MIRCLREVAGASVSTTICVIGSGPVGQTVATRLAARGLPVLLLEAGGREASPEAQRLAATDPRSVGGQYPNVNQIVTIALGGTSDGPSIRLARGGDRTGIRLRQLDRVDVEARPAVGLAGWPIPYDELMAATDAAAAIFGIDSLTGGDDIDLLSSPGLRTADFHVADRRLFSDPSLEAVEGLDVLLDAPVAFLEVGGDGRISTAVVRSEDGREIRVHGASFVIAAAAGATSRMLLSSPTPDGRGVANSSGLVGTGLMDHPIASIGWIDPSKGGDVEGLRRFAPRLSGDRILWPKLVPEPDLVQSDVVAQSWATIVPRRSTASLCRLTSALIPPIGEHTAVGRALSATRFRMKEAILPRLAARRSGTGDIDVAAVAGPVSFGQPWSVDEPFWAEDGGLEAARSFHVLQCPEQLPDKANRFVLTERRDALGRPIARMHWRWSSDDARRQQAFAGLVRDALQDAGLGPVLPPVRRRNRSVERWSTHHLSGGAAMSAEPSTGVVDRHCRSHDHPNLWVAGTSVFPRAGHANPTLTAVATAVIVADDVHAQRP